MTGAALPDVQNAEIDLTAAVSPNFPNLLIRIQSKRAVKSKMCLEDSVAFA